MDNNLYFIPIIERALKEADTGFALGKALEEIRRRGGHEPYSEGFRNFERFMDIACSHLDIIANDYIRRLMAESIMGAFDVAKLEDALLLDAAKLPPTGRDEYESSRDEQATDGPVQGHPIIQVSRDEQMVGQLHFGKVPGRRSIGGIVPGNYILKLLNTGWTVWHGELTDRELLLTEAYGETELHLAAGDEAGRPTRERDLLNNGEVILRTYAGVESGCIEIELAR